ncbi:RNA-guided endonuclease InsQ/TnpB family protein [Vulcanisaeta souniana]|uniref:Transposase n=1 Tax=Vulcanisaeta souniana JCM 11219 TaxID=1293586 RepID=A0A830E966_9CREN|nr:transposase [Vulcanisaeta souniana]BDR92811.1 transposase [Vulcanisaeta souniana JCM 11219]GGI81956.1 transposase [Vulcanisaeta souniana JCM 11219]
MSRVARTVIVRSTSLPRKVFNVFVELEGMYRNMVEQLTMFAVRNDVKSFTKLKALKYREMRNLYPQLPSHYVYTACQDASTRARSFLKLKKHGLAEKEYPEVRSVSIWLDDHLWKPNGLTYIAVVTHKGWVTIEIEPHKQYWRYINGGWRLASEAKIKLDRRDRRVIIYLTFVKEVEEYKPSGYLPVDVNENNVAVLIDGVAHLFETNTEKLVLGYYYRRKRMQERYDKLYGVTSRIKRRIMGRLKERKRKDDVRWKIANIIVRFAHEKRYAIILEKLGKKPASNMIKRIGDKQLRHRIFQASFRGVQKAIEEKAKEYGVPIIYVDPKNTSRLCPIHSAVIVYSNSSRVGKCSKGGELWHRDAVACWNLLLRARLGDGSNAPSLGGSSVDGSPVPLGSTATHDPITLPKGLWARWKSLEVTLNNHKMPRTTL